MLHSYVMRHDPLAEPTTDPVLAPYADMEIPGTLYISSLALHEGWRNRGLGKQFLARAHERANHLGLKGLSLIDYAVNTGARRFYDRHGFRIVDTCQITPHPMIRVTGEAYLMQWPQAWRLSYSLREHEDALSELIVSVGSTVCYRSEQPIFSRSRSLGAEDPLAGKDVLDAYLP